MCSPESREGYAIHMYAATTSMHDCCFCNADGDLLIVPQQGASHARPSEVAGPRWRRACTALL